MKEVIIIAISLGIALLLWLIVGFFVIRYIRRDKSVQYTVGGVPITWGRRASLEKPPDDASQRSPSAREADPEALVVGEARQHIESGTDIRPVHQRHHSEAQSPPNRPRNAAGSGSDNQSALHLTWSPAQGTSLQTSEGSPQITTPLHPSSPLPLPPARIHAIHASPSPPIPLPPPPRYEDAIERPIGRAS